MESFFVRFKNALVLIALLLVQTIALATQVQRAENSAQPEGAQVRLIRLWAAATVSPFERVAAWSGHGIRGGWNNYIGLRHVRQQNADLQKQIAALRLERAALAEDALQAQRLSKLLNFRQHYVSQTVLAQVLGTSGTDGSRMLLLDKGSNDGLKPGMPVITPDGIVGKLRDVFPGTSELLLLSDPSSGAGVLLASTRIRAIVKGSATGRVYINNLTADDRIKPGEQVLTSGGDQVFPRGLPVGTIQSIAPDPEHQPYTAITLLPAANLNQLEEVLVITGMGEGLDPATQGELVADAAAARAADASAERLPSIHDHDAPVDPAAPVDAAPPPANNSTDLVPKPKPVNHPDQYSPGAAPPAADLKPGAPR
jgi:rod shape-determining protein MreC